MNFKLKSKLFCTSLAATFVISIFSSNYQGSAMFGYDSGYEGDVDSDLEVSSHMGVLYGVNLPDEYGWTPIMRAIHDSNAVAVLDLLQKGASLNIMPPELCGRYRNALEYVYGMDVSTIDNDKVFSFRDFSDSIRRKSYEAIVGMILEHCVANHICLNINPNAMSDPLGGKQTLWDMYGRLQYDTYMNAYPSLFKMHI